MALKSPRSPARAPPAEVIPAFIVDDSCAEACVVCLSILCASSLSAIDERSRRPLFSVSYQKGAPRLSNKAESKIPSNFRMLKSFQSGAEISPVLPRMASTSETTRSGMAVLVAPSVAGCVDALILSPGWLAEFAESFDSSLVSFGAELSGDVGKLGAADFFCKLPALPFWSSADLAAATSLEDCDDTPADGCL